MSRASGQAYKLSDVTHSLVSKPSFTSSVELEVGIGRTIPLISTRVKRLHCIMSSASSSGSAAMQLKCMHMRMAGRQYLPGRHPAAAYSFSLNHQTATINQSACIADVTARRCKCGEQLMGAVHEGGGEAAVQEAHGAGAGAEAAAGPEPGIEQRTLPRCCHLPPCSFRQC